MKKLFSYLCLFIPVYLLLSCETDNYDKGEGEYSLMRADFVEAHVGSDKRVDYVITDDGDSLIAEPRFTTKSIETADTTYRAILYYNKVKNSEGKMVAEAKSMSLVPTLNAQSSTSDQKKDPVKFESLWTACNLRYVNVSIILMTGKPDEEDIHQSLGFVCDAVIQHEDGRQTACYSLIHDQGGVPEYYSQQCYLSIPVRSIEADSLRLTLQTYEGEISRTLPLR